MIFSYSSKLYSTRSLTLSLLAFLCRFHLLSFLKIALTYFLKPEFCQWIFRRNHLLCSSSLILYWSCSFSQRTQRANMVINGPLINLNIKQTQCKTYRMSQTTVRAFFSKCNMYNFLQKFSDFRFHENNQRRWCLVRVNDILKRSYVQHTRYTYKTFPR